ncbi:DeoR/GlpR family DNA-binding transcription regulator [Clostridium folliculivorans]|uniref:DeoR family transcriptional regulator n=1 Tax=Clostridium folliculivorans TaxID=2886038 RepID=A0A9W5Y497_9CLOT|nr:DeoR/GlpR family DNA-binding transcription regulator [Clostridium folliculivorans]GKU26290.1 DeoR family transcriptional regulator [Clostridium folliculivorans]GKU31962.1 DeoR family transcriptional regulator [Clostridium folliculivorans]
MFAEERLDAIIKILNTEGKLKVKDLSIKFNVTEDCIRKDLKTLENQSLLKRTYGGAVQVRESAEDIGVLTRKDADITTKTIIAQKAFNIINHRETIFLDISTTNIILAKLLASSNKQITIVTNMLDIVTVLSKPNNIRVICTGGILNRNLDGFTGAPTIEIISKYKFDKSFIGSCGIDVFDESITTFDIDDGITKRAILESSKKSYVVMEDSKFHMDGNYKFACLSDIDCIITEKAPTEEVQSILSDFNIEVF